jgi:Glycosyltransferase family 87
VVAFLVQADRNGDFGIDVRQAFLPAAERVLHGDSPFPAPDSPDVAARAAYAYPPLTALVLAPVSWLPHDAVAVAMTILLALAVVGTLRVLGVVDPLCYAAAFLWGPVLAGLQTANLTLLLALALAAFWRRRDDSARAGPALAAALAPKLFLWPVALWALATRRGRAAVLGVGLAIVVTAVTWAAVGFAGLRDYPQLVRNLTRAERDDSYTIFALARGLGASSDVAWAIWLAAGVAVLVIGLTVAMRGDERRAFVLLVAASLLLTPLVWLHYFAILLVPLAIARPRFDVTWLMPVLLIGASGTGNGGTARTVLVLGVSAAVVAASLVPQRAGQAPQLAVRRSTTSDLSS